MTREEAHAWIKETQSGWRSICQVLHEAYTATDSTEVRELLVDAFMLAKKMDERLKHYKFEGRLDAGERQKGSA